MRHSQYCSQGSWYCHGFPDYALYPHTWQSMTTWRLVKLRKQQGEDIDKRVQEAAEIVWKFLDANQRTCLVVNVNRRRRAIVRDAKSFPDGWEPLSNAGCVTACVHAWDLPKSTAVLGNNHLRYRPNRRRWPSADRWSGARRNEPRLAVP